MLQITLPASRFFNEQTEEFVFYEPVTLKLEHSLISIQRWESKWHKSYLSSENLSAEEMIDYIRCMSLDPNLNPQVLSRLRQIDFERIKDYISDPMTATTFSQHDDPHQRKQIITAEIIYYWMVSFGIPFECAKWHLNQLMTLIKVCSIKNNPKKANKNEAAKQRAALNKARRARMGSTG